MTAPIIIHLSADYPDPLAPAKTKAVLELVEGSPGFRHIVYSLNRVNGFTGQAVLCFAPDRIAMAFKALPLGLLWESRLRALASWIADDLKSQGVKPHLIAAHKFTVEGLIAQDLAAQFSCPYVCGIQGGTDCRILKLKPALRTRYRAIAREAAVIFPFAPWVLDHFTPMAGLDKNKCIILPVVPGFDAMRPAPVIDVPKLVSVFNLDSWQRKNFDGMLRAVTLLRARYPRLKLDVYGRGSAKNFLAMSALIEKFALHPHVRLMGATQNASLPDVLKDYAAFVMPSREESFGLVFTEALFSGLPVLWGKGQGISGFIDPVQIGYAANPKRPEDIAAGIEHLLKNQAQLKASIATLQSGDGLKLFTRAEILKTFSAGLSRAINRG